MITLESAAITMKNTRYFEKNLSIVQMYNLQRAYSMGFGNFVLVYYKS